MEYKRYKIVYYLENGRMIQDIKEFFYRDRKKMLERVLGHLTNNDKITAIDSSGALIAIECKDIVKVQLNHCI